jgi:hypothetical protein
MNIINRITLPILFLLISIPAHAATVTDVTADAYKYVNTNSASSGGLFTNSAFSSSISEAYLWSGGGTNIAGENQQFETNLNTFFENNTMKGANYFDFNSAVKTEDTDNAFEYPITSAIGGILLKQATASLLVLFNAPISQLYWNTEFAGGPGGPGSAGNGNGKLSHYVLIDAQTISQVPVPAALWLFAPALLGFLGLRKKQQ